MKTINAIAIISYTVILICNPGCALEKAQSTLPHGYVPRGANDVYIAPNGIGVPLGRILLVRNISEYYAVKFTKAWTGENTQDRYAAYEVHYMGDGAGNYSNEISKFIKGEASFLRPRGIFRIQFQLGNPIIRCGSLKLLWAYKTTVHFYISGKNEYNKNIELAPTPWATISEIKVFDPRIKWYKYDEKRIDVNIPIDKLWEDTGKKEK